MRTTFSILAAACALSGCSGDTSEGNGADALRLSELPLKWGYYVMSDVACGQASNATLLLVLPDGISGSQDYCAIRTIEQTGPMLYRVTEQCASPQSGSAVDHAHSVEWHIPDDTSFTATSAEGWQRGARYCKQTTLPAPWRDNDITALIGESTDP